MNGIEPVSALRHEPASSQIQNASVDFDTVARDAGKLVARIDQGTVIGGRMPQASNASAMPAAASEGGGVDGVLRALRSSTYSQALVGLVGNIGQTVKTLLRGS